MYRFIPQFGNKHTNPSPKNTIQILKIIFAEIFDIIANTMLADKMLHKNHNESNCFNQRAPTTYSIFSLSYNNRDEIV